MAVLPRFVIGASLALGVAALLPADAAARGKENPLARLEPVAASEPIPAIDFFRPPRFTQPALNPGGTHLAALMSIGADRWELMVVEVATGKLSGLTVGSDYDVANFHWLDDDQLLFSVTRLKLYSVGLFLTSRERLNRAYPLSRHNVVAPIGLPTAEPGHVIAWIKHSVGSGGGDGGVLKLDALSARNNSPGFEQGAGEPGITTKIRHRYPELPFGVAVGYLADVQGELAFGFGVRDGQRHLFRLRSGGWEECAIDLELVEVLGVSSGADELLVLEPWREHQPRAVRPFNLATGNFGEPLFSDADFDLSEVTFYRHPVDRRLLGAHVMRKSRSSLWLDPAYQALQAGINELFPNQIAEIVGSDRAERHYLVRTHSDQHPSSYHHVDMEARTAGRIVTTTPWIDPARMRPMQLVSYKTRDGFQVDGYVTLPAGASKQTPVPLIVLPHGGPWARDGWGWDPEVQFLASRGYAVFQPNYRGSTGSLWRFRPEEAWNFRKMHDDVTDGVAAMLRTGLIDRDRLAIMGASFGGYLAMCGAAFEPATYRCAITIAGVFDWERVMHEERRNAYRPATHGLLRRYLGDPKSEQERFEAISPLRAVNQIRIPVFVAHGEEDPMAAVGQSRRLVGQLKKHRVKFVSHFAAEEGHGFHHLENRVKLYERIERFLAEHMAPRSRPNNAAP